MLTLETEKRETFVSVLLFRDLVSGLWFLVSGSESSIPVFQPQTRNHKPETNPLNEE